jgi:hypothetical protein
MYAYRALANYFSEKVKAAELVLRYKYSNEVNDLDKAVNHLAKSIMSYKELVDLTKNTYLYANSMQTGQRKIPVGGDGGKNKTWVELLPFYEQELNNFKINLDSLKRIQGKTSIKLNQQWKSEPVSILNGKGESYTLDKFQNVFTDSLGIIKDFAPELKELKGIRLSKIHQLTDGTMITFKNNKPIKVIVGYFNSKDKTYLQPSSLETDASANDFGQAESKITNALAIEGMPPVNIHTFAYKAGTNTLTLGKGVVLILGFINDNQQMKSYDAGVGIDETKKELDWLFE